ncbi:MAG: alpha/beta hydrolase [Methylovirgula sp.]|jgi:pimeloyl-ACP methyl ester carboxylesterase
MHEFSSNGVTIAYIDEAPATADKGEPILLIHGFASTHAINWVFPQWVKTLTEAGRRVVAFDNRGHGRSEKLYRPEDYRIELTAEDAVNLLDHLGIEKADIMGYSMGACIATFVAKTHKKRLRRLVLGGIGENLIDTASVPLGVTEAMEAPSVAVLKDPIQIMFRQFAEATKSDLKALAACSRGIRYRFSVEELAEIDLPVLIAVGTKDEVAGDPSPLGRLFPNAHMLPIPDRDHNRAVGDQAFKRGVLDFLAKN